MLMPEKKISDQDSRGRFVETWSLDDLALGKAQLPLAAPVTVFRPFSWKKPIESLLAKRIRDYSGQICGHKATEHHAMLYLGGGTLASQDWVYKTKGFEEYVGCTLSFYKPPWTAQECLNVIEEAQAHKGRFYGVMDIAGQVMRALTGRRAWVKALGDKDCWICSEAVCRVIRKIKDPEYGGSPYCDHTPQGLADWMEQQEWPVRRVLIKQ